MTSTKIIIVRDSIISDNTFEKLQEKIFELFDSSETTTIRIFNHNDLEVIPKRYCYGSLVVLASKINFQSYGQKFPNNTIIVDDDLDVEKLEKVAKQAKWILTNFGREKNMDSKTWFTSDTHFWHENIIKYCNRPYANAQEMNEDLIEKWNARVKENDIVWHLGDFCFGCKEHITEIVPRLNGRINLVLGNHDHHRIGFYYDAGFHRVYDHPVVISNFFILSHEPMQWIKDGDVYTNIYGHVHNQEMYKDFTSNSFCACVERTGYAPVSWTDMLEKMKSAVSIEEGKK